MQANPGTARPGSSPGEIAPLLTSCPKDCVRPSSGKASSGLSFCPEAAQIELARSRAYSPANAGTARDTTNSAVTANNTK